MGMKFPLMAAMPRYICDATLYMYGQDADRLFEAVRPILKAATFMVGAKVRKRYGPPKDEIRETRTTIASQFDRG
jgi:hypothetical protein